MTILILYNNIFEFFKDLLIGRVLEQILFNEIILFSLIFYLSLHENNQFLKFSFPKIITKHQFINHTDQLQRLKLNFVFYFLH